MISERKLGSGGRPKLDVTANSHHAANTANRGWYPAFSFMIRVWVRSYMVFARTNNADDVKPWETIITIAPVKPHEDWVRIPAVTIPMCPTEE